MTKSITDIARQFADLTTDARGRETFTFDSYGLELLKAAHLEELTGVEMPEPVGKRDFKFGADLCTEDVFTLDQLRTAVAAAVLREREACAKTCEQFAHYGEASGITCVKAIRKRSKA